jgi:hypothetical protein
MVQQTVIWGVFCLAALAAASRRPRVSRVVLGVFFIVMALGINVVLAIVAPDNFVAIGTATPLLSAYEWVFAHVVSTAPVAFGVTVAAFEIAAGLLMIRGGRLALWGLTAGMAFLVASSLLGAWALPNLILAVALAVILVNQRRLIASGVESVMPSPVR